MDDVSLRLAVYERDAWIPVLEARDDPPTVSKFSGSPFLSSPWPVCQSCAEPMLFLMQLKIAELPNLPEEWLISPVYEMNREHGIIQVFNCDEPECALSTGEPHSGANFTTLSYTWSSPHAAAMRPGKPAVEPARVICGWTPIKDRPCREELLELDVRITAEDDHDVQRLHESGDKLLGWPTFAAGAERPCCHLCGQKMLFLFQIACLPFRQHHARGFIHVCPEHPLAAFSWAEEEGSRNPVGDGTL